MVWCQPRSRQLRAFHTDTRTRAVELVAQAMAQRSPDDGGYVWCSPDEGVGKQVREVILLLDVKKPNWRCKSVGLFLGNCPFNSYSLLSIYAIDAKCPFFVKKFKENGGLSAFFYIFVKPYCRYRLCWQTYWKAFGFIPQHWWNRYTHQIATCINGIDENALLLVELYTSVYRPREWAVLDFWFYMQGAVASLPMVDKNTWPLGSLFLFMSQRNQFQIRTVWAEGAERVNAHGTDSL